MPYLINSKKIFNLKIAFSSKSSNNLVGLFNGGVLP